MLSKMILTAVLLGSSLLSGADFFPIRHGNRWTYRESKTGQTFTIHVGTPVLTDGRVYYSLNGYVTKRVLVRTNENNDLVYLNEDSGTEHPLTSFEPFEGGWWQAPFRQCDQLGQTQVRRGTHDGPVGPLDVLEIRYRSIGCADAGVEREQYAENIGMVRRVSTSFLGPVQYDLISAQVGGVRINMATNAKFEVTVEPAAKADEMAVTLRLQTNPATPFTLRFPTGQEFDIEVRDETGVLLSRWSTGRMFTFAVHERQISGEWAMTVTMPRPRGSGGQSKFMVLAWMTTSALMPPLYAAMVPVEYPALQR